MHNYGRMTPNAVVDMLNTRAGDDKTQGRGLGSTLVNELDNIL